MKICTHCHIMKPLEDFPRDKRAKTGRGSRCNACMSIILAEYRATEKGHDARRAAQQKYDHSPIGQAHRKEYARTPEQKAKRRTYAKTEHGQKVMRESREKYRKQLRETENGRLQLQARMAVRHAIDRGELPPVSAVPCSRCGIQAEHYHHDSGYSRAHWLSVIPVCHKCHNEIHRA